MNRIALCCFVSFLWITPAVSQEVPPNHAEQMQAGTALFKETIRPAMESHCLKCHGGDKVRGGFDLSSRKLLLDGGDSGELVDLESPKDSYLLLVIRHEEEPTMPPSEDKLTDALIDDFEKWISLGAPYDKPLIEKSETAKSEAMVVTESDREFWSFKPIVVSDIPVDNSQWGSGPIDSFIANKLNQIGLKPNPPADDRTRIRRTYLDLIGLPPTVAQLKAARKMSHTELVDALLQSPHYGERWARHWLDAARFGESYGFEQDTDRNFAYHYRDFVIKAFNQDMPWDQFVRWQIAGDEIAPNNPMALMATGFLGAGVFPTQLTENEFEIARYDELDDMAATTGTAMLGMTIGCARCHDHKFDPIPVKDYYQFVSTFTTTIRSEIDVTLDAESHQKKLKAWQASHDKLVASRERFANSEETTQAFGNWLTKLDPSNLKTSEWQVLQFEAAKSSKPVTKLSQQQDGAVLASGNPPKFETYQLRSQLTPGTIRFIRLEALTHPSMKQNGPGRASNGNFGLGDLRVFVTQNSPDKKPARQRLELGVHEFTHQQNDSNLSVKASVSDDSSKTGWAVDFGGIGKQHAAIFRLKQPLHLTGDSILEFELDFGVNTAHSLGRFRISTTGNATPRLIIGGGQDVSLQQAINALKTGEPTENQKQVLRAEYLKNDPTWGDLEQQVQQSLSRKPEPTTTKVQVSSEGYPGIRHLAAGRGFKHFYPETHFLERGDPNQKTGVASPGFLQVLMRNGKTNDHWKETPPAQWKRTSYRRTGLANWMTDTENGAGHLLARVAVNRIWHHHFGKGIVATPNDFGLQGARPTHPQLLDFLAQRLIKNNWSIKQLHREILLSSTWRQSSKSDPEKFAADPENNLLWRFTPRRLEAEAVRDSLLSVSGQLNRTMFGKGSLDPGQKRRSIYFTIKRSRLIPMMQIFDQPEPLTSQGGRPATIIAPQALLFMNNPDVVSWAFAFADEVSSKTDFDAVTEIYLRTLGREPTDLELNESAQFLKEQAATYPDGGRKRALADFCQVVFGLNEFIFVR